MKEEKEVLFGDEDWEPVSSGDYNDLNFVKPGETDTEENEIALEEGEYVQGRFQGTVELGGVPNFKVVNESDEIDYMFSKTMVLESELESVEEGDVLRVRFDGEQENEDGTRSYLDYTVLTPTQ